MRVPWRDTQWWGGVLRVGAAGTGKMTALAGLLGGQKKCGCSYGRPEISACWGAAPAAHPGVGTWVGGRLTGAASKRLKRKAHTTSHALAGYAIGGISGGPSSCAAAVSAEESERIEPSRIFGAFGT